MVVVEEVAHDPAQRQCGHDLGKRDEEVEYPHVDARPVGGDRTGEDDVRHRDGAGPADADPGHREQQHPRLMDYADAEQAGSATQQAQRVRAAMNQPSSVSWRVDAVE